MTAPAHPLIDAAEIASAMRAVIDEHTAGGPYVPRQAAEEIVEKLRANNPGLLAAWLDSQAAHFVWQMINDRDRSLRGRAAHVAKSSVFRAAATNHATGDSTALPSFLAAPYTVGDGSRRALADLRREDLIYVADRYDDRARENGLKAAFLRALAKKIETGTVAEHFDEARLAQIWESLAA